MTDVLVFGYAAYGAGAAMRERVARFSTALGALAKAELAVYEASSYEELAKGVVRGQVDLAWLPPLAFVALERRNAVFPLVSALRGGDTAFYSALIVRKLSLLDEPEDLVGKRAAWVDRYSASGYVVPRAGLAALDVDPRTAFVSQRFYHSHEGVVRAVLGGHADFGATYAGLDASGAVTRGPWMSIPGADDALRVLLRFGAIAADVVAARTELPAVKRELIARALLALCQTPANRALLGEAFGIDEFRRWSSPGYDELRRLTEDASNRGLLDGEETATEVPASDTFLDDDEDDDEPTR